MGSAVAIAAALFLLHPAQPGEPATIQLASSEYVTTPADRQFLKYLVRCALPKGVVAVSDSRYGHFSFDGGMGFAPDWAERPLTGQEQELVSACVLALTNKFGISVPVYLVAGTEPPSDQRRKKDGSQDHSLFEGAFFGNIFLPTPKAFVCIGDGRTMAPRDPVWKKRVCSLPDGKGGSKSACDMIIVGKCRRGQPYTVSGKIWADPVQVYLHPEAGASKASAPLRD